MSELPLLPVCSVDPVLRDVTSAGLLLDLPGALVLQHDLDPGGTLRRTVHDAGGVRERAAVELEHGCLACALRADVLPALRRLVDEAPAAVVLALPVTAEAAPVARALALGDVRGAALGAAIAVTDPASLERDLLGDDLLAERGLALSADDRRAVGEVLARQLEFADVVALGGPAGDRAAALLAHLVPGGPDLRPLDALRPAGLLDVRRPPGDDRGDPRRAEPTGAPDAAGVWTVDLHSWRPFHPGRLLDRLTRLGGGPLRGRGRFWLPTRPGTVGIWDGAGGQLSIGAFGSWAGEPETRIVVTGVGGDPGRVRRAFAEALLTDAELARGLRRWAGRDDGFDPWLGAPRLSA